jgi:hypothetical protein
VVRLPLALVGTLGVLLAVPQAAAAGGWWSYPSVNRSHVAPGQSVELKETVLFSSAAAAQAAQQADRFHVYLLRNFDYSVVDRAMRTASPGNWWSLGGAEAVEVGQVTVRASDGTNLGKASAAFTVPELPPATYHLMLCDTGCTEPLADVIPAKGFTVVADLATARMANRVDRLERSRWTQAQHLAGARAESDRALKAARNARAELEQLETSVASLANEGRTTPPATGWAYAGWLVAGALAGALAMLVLRRRRLRPPGPARDAGWHPSDEELRELLRR